MFTVTLKSTNHFLYILLGLIKKYTAWYSKHDPPTHTPEKEYITPKRKEPVASDGQLQDLYMFLSKAID